MNTKRETWQAVQEHVSEGEELIRELAQRFGLDAAKVETDEQTWQWERGNE